MSGVIETCKCGRKFFRGIWPQSKCWVCEVENIHVWPEQKIKPEKGGDKE